MNNFFSFFNLSTNVESIMNNNIKQIVRFNDNKRERERKKRED